MKTQTPLQQVWKISGLSSDEFSDLLGLKAPTVESYRLNKRPLPLLPELQKLKFHFGVDPLSLITPEHEEKCQPDQIAMTITGQPFTAESCRQWKAASGMRKEEITIAVMQLRLMLEATLQLLTLKEPHTARIFLQGINRAINKAVRDNHLKSDLEQYFKREFGTTTKLDRYKTGYDLRQENDDLPLGNSHWGSWITRFNPNLPIDVFVTTYPTPGTPDLFITHPALSAESKYELEIQGLGAARTRCKSYSVTQLRKTEIFNDYTFDASPSGELSPNVRTEMNEHMKTYSQVNTQKREQVQKRSSNTPAQKPHLATRKLPSKAAPIGRVGGQQHKVS